MAGEQPERQIAQALMAPTAAVLTALILARFAKSNWTLAGTALVLLVVLYVAYAPIIGWPFRKAPPPSSDATPADPDLERFAFEMDSFVRSGRELEERGRRAGDHEVVGWTDDFSTWRHGATRYFAAAHEAHLAEFEAGARAARDAGGDAASPVEYHQYLLRELAVRLGNLERLIVTARSSR